MAGCIGPAHVPPFLAGIPWCARTAELAGGLAITRGELGGKGGQGNWAQSSHSPHPCPFPVLGAGAEPLGPGLILGHLHSLYPNLLSRAGRQRPSEQFLNRQKD